MGNIILFVIILLAASLGCGLAYIDHKRREREFMNWLFDEGDTNE